MRGLPPGDRYLAVAVEGVARAVLARPEMLAAVRAAATPLRVDDGGTHAAGADGRAEAAAVSRRFGANFRTTETEAGFPAGFRPRG